MKVWIIRGIGADENNKLCDKMVSKCAWATKREALSALKREEYEECFSPHICQCTIS